MSHMASLQTKDSNSNYQTEAKLKIPPSKWVVLCVEYNPIQQTHVNFIRHVRRRHFDHRYSISCNEKCNNAANFSL